MVKLTVFERHGHPETPAPDICENREDFLSILELPNRGIDRDVSSTNVRRLLASGTDPTEEDVLAGVLEYIHTHHLFESTAS